MARRVERTTGLPRPRPRSKVSHDRRLAGITWTEARIRQAVVGAAAALLVLVIAAFAFQIYQERIGRPHEVVVRVGSQEFNLGYYRDRLLPFLKANQNSETSAALQEEALLDKLIEEGLTIELGHDKGIALSKDDITKSIAEDLGTTVDAPSFETLYRAKLKTQAMGDGSYRRLSEAAAVNKRLLDVYRQELGGTGEQLTMRTVVLGSKEDAQKVFDRVKAGEDLGTLAQTQSLDLETRTKDGVLPPETPALIPENVRKAVEGQPEKALLGPVQVQDKWWVFRIEKRETGAYTEAQKSQLTQQKLDNALKAKRAELTAAGKLDRSMSADQLRWAEKNVNK